MDSNRMFTIEDAMTRPLFAQAEVIGGSRGISNSVRWVHILESSNFESLIHGEEMILTTGIQFHSQLTTALEFMDNLIQKKAACLCIELGDFFQTIPVEMIELADRYDFPLIIFKETVRFVDITLDLHSLIINHHHRMLQKSQKRARTG